MKKSFKNVATFATGKKNVLAHVSSQITPFVASLLAAHTEGTRAYTATGVRLVVGNLEIKVKPNCDMFDAVKEDSPLPTVSLRSRNGRMDASEVNRLLDLVAKTCNSRVKFNPKTGLNEFGGLLT